MSDNFKNLLYQLEDTENTVCITCDHVLNANYPILYVAHDSDGYWQFLCGTESHSEKSGKIISLKEAIELGFIVNELFDMPLGMSAQRTSIRGTWQFCNIPEEKYNDGGL